MDPSAPRTPLPARRSRIWAVVAVGLLGLSFVINNTPSKRRAAALDAWAQRARAHLPEAVNDDLQVVGVHAESNGVTFLYSLPHARKGELDVAALDEAEEKRVRERSCTVFRSALAAGGYLGFHYDDRDGAPVTDLYVLPSDCGMKDPEDVSSMDQLRRFLRRRAEGR